MTTTAKASDHTEMDGTVVDTVTLLQEEIARLEAELRLRDELDAARTTADAAPDGRDAGADDQRRIAELAGELAERDRTIELLWEQLTLQEEAEAAARAEWEQLHRWVEELERRVEGAASSDLAAEEAVRRDAETQRNQFDAERLSWESRRRSLEHEIADLRSRLEQEADRAGTGADPDRSVLEKENRRLRAECQRLVTAAAQAASAEMFQTQLQAAREELEARRRELAQALDDLHRQRIEHEAELAAIRTRLTRQRVSEGPDGLSLNERMRALRDHLAELHQQEETERRNRRLSARVARLWRRTGPAPSGTEPSGTSQPEGAR